MPIFRTGTGLGYFAEVPGCGGATMVRHLETRFGPPAFHDPAHTDGPPNKRWSRTSPQHVGRKTLARLFPPGFFVASFAVVRHPADRLRAVYTFQREVEGAVPQGVEFGEWLEDLVDRVEDEPFVFDNAVRPMADLVPEDAEVFRFEDGGARIGAWLDRLTGVSGPAPDLRPGPDQEIPLSPFDLDSIAQLHAIDFQRFDYGRQEQRLAAPATIP